MVRHHQRRTSGRSGATDRADRSLQRSLDSHKCKIALLAVAIIAAALSFLAASAKAYTGDPETDPGFTAQRLAILDGTYQPIVLDSQVAPTFFSAANAAGRMPMVLEGLGTVAMAVGAFDIGWKIGRTIDTKWLHLEGNTGVPPPNGADFSNTPKWQSNATGLVSATTVPLGIYVTWSGMPDASCGTSGNLASWRNFGYWPTNDTGLSGGAKTCVDELISMATAVAAQGYTAVNVTAETCGSSTPFTTAGDGCEVLYRPESTLEGQTISSLPQAFTNQTANVTTTMPASGGTAALPNAPTGSMTQTQDQAAQTIITANPTADGWAKCELDPADYACPGTNSGGAVITQPVTLPEPLPDETTEQYAARLREAGYEATIVIVPDPNSYPLGSPAQLLPAASMTGVRIGTAGSFTTVYDPLTGLRVAWPLAPPQFLPSGTTATTEVDLQAIPGTAPVTTETQTDCSTCAIDWTPIESISFGTKFPFGTFTWLNTGLSAIAPSGTCPTLHITDPFGGADHLISFCNTDWETTYRPWVFPLIEGLMTLMAVAYFGSKLLGSGTDS